MSRFDKTKVTAEFLIEADGIVVWTMDDYLSMRDISDDEELVEFLDYVEEVKNRTREFYEFKY